MVRLSQGWNKATNQPVPEAEASPRRRRDGHNPVCKPLRHKTATRNHGSYIFICSTNTECLVWSRTPCSVGVSRRRPGDIPWRGSSDSFISGLQFKREQQSCLCFLSVQNGVLTCCFLTRSLYLCRDSLRRLQSHGPVFLLTFQSTMAPEPFHTRHHTC